jgi:outer membrane protein assembly factor BamB
MRRRALLASVVAASGSIAGCSSATFPGSRTPTETPPSSGPPGDTSPTVQFQYDAHHTGVSDTTAPTSVDQRWRSRIAPTDGGLSVADGRVVVAGGGSLVALSVDGGDQLWDASLGHDVLAPPTLTGDTAYVTGWSAGNGEGGAVAVDLATGGERWRALPDLDVSSAVTLANDTVYVGGALDNPSVVTLDAVDGSEQWRVEAGEYAPTPAVADGLAIAGGGEQPVVYGLDIVTGGERWRVDVDGPVWGAPTVVDGRVYVGTRAGSLYAPSVADGARQWRVPVGDDLRGSLAVANGTVYAPDTEALHAVSTEGEEL